MKRLFFAISIAISLLVLGCELTPPNMAKYRVIYHGNGNTYGFPPTDNTQYASGAEVAVLGKGTLEKTGYAFQNWNNNSQGTGTSYTGGDKIKINNANVFLYAIWVEADKYIVSFNSSNGDLIEPITGILPGEKIAKPQNPSKAGYSFIGWYKDEQLSTAWNFTIDTVTENITLYAKWELIPLSTVSTYNRFYFEKTEWIQNGDEKIYKKDGKLQYTLYWTDPTYSTFDHIEIISISNESVLHTINKGIEQIVIEYGPYDDIISNHNLSYGRARTVDIYGNKSGNSYCPSIPGGFTPSMIPNPWTIDVSDVRYTNNLITWTNPTDARFCGLLLVENGGRNFQTRNIFLEKVTSYIPSKNSTSVTIYSINSIGGGLSSGVTLNYGPPNMVYYMARLKLEKQKKG
jgi:uncharacterized repeat protein (TIGR02543 family)